MTTDRPLPLSKAVSDQFAKMPRRDTKPELALRRELHRRGMRFRVAFDTIPGTPDLAFTRARLAVFVDGCFWHGCPEHYIAPKNNAEWWARKLAVNQGRDARTDDRLTAVGWLPLHVWEHEPISSAADAVETFWRQRIGR